MVLTGLRGLTRVGRQVAFVALHARRRRNREPDLPKVESKKRRARVGKTGLQNKQPGSSADALHSADGRERRSPIASLTAGLHC